MSDQTTETPEEKIARLQNEKAKREEAEEAAARARDVEALELESKFSEIAGKRGVDFEMIRTRLGTFVVKRADFLAQKRFDMKSAKDVSIEDVIQLVRPCLLHPTPEAALAIFQTHGGIAWACCKALRALYAVDEEERSGKS